jgi:hypothetical protein
MPGQRAAGFPGTALCSWENTLASDEKRKLISDLSSSRFCHLLFQVSWIETRSAKQSSPAFFLCQAEIKMSANQELKKSTFQDVNLSPDLLSEFFKISTII